MEQEKRDTTKNAFEMSREERQGLLENIQNGFSAEEEPETNLNEEIAEDKSDTTNDSLKDFNEKLEKLEKRLSDKEEFIQRQAAELGLLRKKIKKNNDPFEEIDDEIDGLLDDEIETGKEADSDEKELQKEVEKQKIINQDKEFLTSVSGKNEEDLIKETVSMLREDGFSEEQLAKVKKDFFGFGIDLTFQVTKRLLANEKIKELQKQIEDLRDKPNQLLDKIQNASKAKPVVGGSSKSVSDGSGLSPYKMSREERQKLIEQFKKG